VLLDVPADLPAVAPGHHHVEKNECGLYLLERPERIVTVVGDGDRVSTRLEIIADDVRVIRVVIDYEDRGVS
jgi:hypothetical protein